MTVRRTLLLLALVLASLSVWSYLQICGSCTG